MAEDEEWRSGLFKWNGMEWNDADYALTLSLSQINKHVDYILQHSANHLNDYRRATGTEIAELHIARA